MPEASARHTASKTCLDPLKELHGVLISLRHSAVPPKRQVALALQKSKCHPDLPALRQEEENGRPGPRAQGGWHAFPPGRSAKKGPGEYWLKGTSTSLESLAPPTNPPSRQ